MNIIEKIDEYVEYVKNNFQKVEAEMAMIGHPLFEIMDTGAGNEYLKCFKIMEISADTPYRKELKYYYFEKFMNKVKNLLINGKIIYFKMGFFNYLDENGETNLDILKIDSNESEWKVFLENVGYSFFSLSLMFQHVLDDEEKKYAIDMKNLEIYETFKNEEKIIISIEDLLDDENLSSRTKKEKILLLGIKSIRDVKSMGDREQVKLIRDLLKGLSKEELELENNKVLDEEMFQYLIKEKDNILEGLNILAENPYCSEEMKEIYIKVSLKNYNKKNVLDFFRKSCGFYLFYRYKMMHYWVMKNFGGETDLDMNYLKDIQKFFLTKDKDCKMWNDMELCESSAIFDDENIVNNSLKVRTNKLSDKEIYLDVVKEMSYVTSEANPHCRGIGDKVSRAGTLLYILGLLDYLDKLPHSEVMKVLRDKKNKILFSFLASPIFNYEMLKKYYDKTKGFDIDILNYIEDIEIFTTLEFSVHKGLLPVEKTIKNKYLSISKMDKENEKYDDFLKISFMNNINLTKPIECLEFIKDIYEAIVSEDVEEQESLIACKFREIKVKQLMSLNDKETSKDIIKKKI